jgi:hypothetical protein
MVAIEPPFNGVSAVVAESGESESGENARPIMPRNVFLFWAFEDDVWESSRVCLSVGVGIYDILEGLCFGSVLDTWLVDFAGYKDKINVQTGAETTKLSTSKYK